jgi:hypothetical protein
MKVLVIDFKKPCEHPNDLGDRLSIALSPIDQGVGGIGVQCAICGAAFQLPAKDAVFLAPEVTFGKFTSLLKDNQLDLLPKDAGK